MASTNREKPRTGQHAGLFFQITEPPDTPCDSPRSDDVPLVLLPGLLADGRQLSRLCRLLARLLQRRLYVVDPLGAGRSDAPADTEAYAFPVQSDRLAELLSALQLPMVDVVGFSMGGMWAQHALLGYPERFRHAGLVATTAVTDPRLRSIVLGLRAQHRAGVSGLDLFRTLQVMFFSAGFLDHPSIIPMLEAMWGEHRHAPAAVEGQLAALLSHDLRARLPNVTQVRVVIAGAEDFLMPPLVQTRLSGYCHQPAPELIPSAGHALWIECPDLLAEALAAALNQARPAAR